MCLAVVGVIGCYGPSPKVGVPCSSDGTCPAGQHCNVRIDPPTCEAGDARPIDAPPDAPPTCAGPADCTGSLPICDLTTTYCRACRADAECGTNEVCVESAGTCHNDSNALFIAPGASGSCTRASPCSLASALAQAANNQKIIVVLDGTYAGTFTLSSFTPNSLTLSGTDNNPAGAVITPPLGDGLTISASSKTIIVEGVTVATAPGTGVTNSASLTLAYVVIRGSGQVGVTSSNALTLVDSTVQNSATQGVEVTGGSVEIRRTSIHGHAGGGLSITGASYTIENTIIANNGLSGSAYGGVRITNVDGLTPQVFQFNTVAANVASISEAAMTCPATLAVDSSIFTQPFGPCTATFSLMPGTDPLFVSAMDFHLQPSSPAIDMANPDATIVDDVDGQNRAGARDIGADEIVP